MSIRRFWITIAVLSFTSALRSTYATPACLEGTVRDGQWHPIENVIIRIEAKSGNQFATTIKTDARGHYSYGYLDTGTYRVTLLVDGIVKASINNAKATDGESRRLDFDLTGRYGARATHLVYLPETKASHLGGHWVDVDKVGHPNNVSVDNVQTLSRFGETELGIASQAHMNVPNYRSPASPYH
jgi:hypothetical protein